MSLSASCCWQSECVLLLLINHGGPGDSQEHSREETRRLPREQENRGLEAKHGHDRPARQQRPSRSAENQKAAAHFEEETAKQEGHPGNPKVKKELKNVLESLF